MNNYRFRRPLAVLSSFRAARIAASLGIAVSLFASNMTTARAEIKVERTTYAGLSSYPGGATYNAYVKFRSSDHLSNVKIWLYYDIEGWKLFNTQRTVLTPDAAAVTFSQFLASPQPNAKSGFVEGVLSLPSTLRGNCKYIWVEGITSRGYLDYDYRAGCDFQ